MITCIYGRINSCIFLLGMGAEHHLVDSNGDTAAHWATYKGVFFQNFLHTFASVTSQYKFIRLLRLICI